MGVCVSLDFVFVLFERQRDCEWETNRWRKIFLPLVHSPNAHIAGTGPVQSQDPRTQSELASWVAGSPVLEPSSGATLHTQGEHQPEAGIGSGAEA